MTAACSPVVIAIAHWNRVDLLRQCVASLRAHTDYPNARICVFDQGSTDGSVEFLRGLEPEVDVIYSPRNLGFVHATNAIIARYQDRDVVLLNNDTRVTAGWLTALVDTASRSDSIGIIGAKLVTPGGVLRDAGGDVFADGRVRARGRSAAAADPRYQERREVDYCSAACLYVKRAVFDRCGTLAAQYEAGYYEDVDLAFSAHAAGFKILYEPRCVVIHREHGSYGADVAGTLMRRHRDIFRSRWAERLALQPSSPFELPPAGGRPRLLLLTELAPLNTLSPRARRVRQLIRALNGEFDVAYLNATQHGFDRYAAVAEELGAVPFYSSMNVHDLVALDEEELIRINYFPIAVCGSPDSERFLRGRFPSVLLDATTVIVDIGMEADVVAGAARTTANHFVAITEAQRRALISARPDAQCTLLPVDPERTTTYDLSREARNDVVILSDNLDGPAAAGAIAEMVRAIVPPLRESLNGARWRINGGPLAAELIATLPCDLESVPTSSAVGSVLDRARIVVVPQHWCAPETVSNLAEARARRIPIVTTPAAADAAGLFGSTGAATAETAEQFVAVIERLYSDPWYWYSIAGTPPTRMAGDGLVRALARWASGDVPAGGS
jgi:GT2 family glycosyltransferase